MTLPEAEKIVTEKLSSAVDNFEKVVNEAQKQSIIINNLIDSMIKITNDTKKTVEKTIRNLGVNND